MLKLYVMNSQLLLESKFLHDFFNNNNSTNYITYFIITFIFVKNYRSSIFFLLVIINYKYNNLLNITLIFIFTVKLL